MEHGTFLVVDMLLSEHIGMETIPAYSPCLNNQNLFFKRFITKYQTKLNNMKQFYGFGVMFRFYLRCCFVCILDFLHMAELISFG